MIMIFLVAVLPQNVANVYDYMEKLKLYGGTFYILILPVVLLILDSIKGGKQI